MGLPAGEKTTTATRMPQKVDNSEALLNSPLRRLEYVTKREAEFSIAAISVLRLLGAIISD